MFRKFAEFVSYLVGTPWAFIGAVLLIATWGLTGPVFKFSEQWQLVINSFTTIVTFLMVFVIQSTQNRDFKAMQIKFDALLLGSVEAQRGVVNLHNFSDHDIRELERKFEELASGDNVAKIIAALEHQLKRADGGSKN